MNSQNVLLELSVLKNNKNTAASDRRDNNQNLSPQTQDMSVQNLLQELSELEKTRTETEFVNAVKTLGIGLG